MRRATKVRSGKIKTASKLLEELSPIVPDDALFKEEFAMARQTKPAVSRYLLLALERTRLGEAQPELVPNSNEDDVNLQHILPRAAKDDEWPSFDPDEVSRWSSR